MNPQEQVCHNPQCYAYGRPGAGQIVIHSQTEQRKRCKRCGTTFRLNERTVADRQRRAGR